MKLFLSCQQWFNELLEVQFKERGIFQRRASFITSTFRPLDLLVFKHIICIVRNVLYNLLTELPSELLCVLLFKS